MIGVFLFYYLMIGGIIFLYVAPRIEDRSMEKYGYVNGRFDGVDVTLVILLCLLMWPLLSPFILVLALRSLRKRDKAVPTWRKLLG